MWPSCSKKLVPFARIPNSWQFKQNCRKGTFYLDTHTKNLLHCKYCTIQRNQLNKNLSEGMGETLLRKRHNHNFFVLNGKKMNLKLSRICAMFQAASERIHSGDQFHSRIAFRPEKDQRFLEFPNKVQFMDNVLVQFVKTKLTNSFGNLPR